MASAPTSGLNTLFIGILINWRSSGVVSDSQSASLGLASAPAHTCNVLYFCVPCDSFMMYIKMLATGTQIEIKGGSNDGSVSTINDQAKGGTLLMIDNSTRYTC